MKTKHEKPKRFKIKVRAAIAKNELRTINVAKDIYPDLPQTKAVTKFNNLVNNGKWVEEDILNKLRIILKIEF